MPLLISWAYRVKRQRQLCHNKTNCRNFGCSEVYSNYVILGINELNRLERRTQMRCMFSPKSKEPTKCFFFFTLGTRYNKIILYFEREILTCSKLLGSQELNGGGRSFTSCPLIYVLSVQTSYVMLSVFCQHQY